jgi:hypothetical protein
MLIMREGAVLRSSKTDTERRMKGLATILDIIESTVEDPDDLEYLMNLAATGKVGFAELLHLVAPEQEDEAPKAPVRRATRKR